MVFTTPNIICNSGGGRTCKTYVSGDLLIIDLLVALLNSFALFLSPPEAVQSSKSFSKDSNVLNLPRTPSEFFFASHQQHGKVLECDWSPQRMLASFKSAANIKFVDSKALKFSQLNSFLMLK